MQRFTSEQIESLTSELISKTLKFSDCGVTKNKYFAESGKVQFSDVFTLSWIIYFECKNLSHNQLMNAIKNNENIITYPTKLILELNEYLPPKREQWEKKYNDFPDEDFEYTINIVARNSFNLTNGAVRLQDDIYIKENSQFKSEYLEFLNIIRNLLIK